MISQDSEQMFNIRNKTELLEQLKQKTPGKNSQQATANKYIDYLSDKKRNTLHLRK